MRRHSFVMLALFAALLLTAACSEETVTFGDGDAATDGDTTDGDSTDGDVIDGDAVDGDDDGDAPEPDGPCDSDADCIPSQYCDPCAASSCPGCDNCIALCVDQTCVGETELSCDAVRPTCAGLGDAQSVIIDGCWYCVDTGTCGSVFKHDARCDDGTAPLCNSPTPQCKDDEILAFRKNCYACLNPETCAPSLPDACSGDIDCPVTDYCDECAASSCPECDDCLSGCVPHGCNTEAEPVCESERPECIDNGVAVVRDGCWVCIVPFTCEPVEERDSHCDDGSEPTCEMSPPACGDEEILAYQDDCYICVNPDTCKVWGELGCASDADCPPQSWCDPCGTKSCPACEDCEPACKTHNCETEAQPSCNMIRPECPADQIAVVRDGCWVCVYTESCEIAERDTHCDDGSEPTCEMVTPNCSNDEILAYQGSCYVCVNPVTCKPWGVPNCVSDHDCAPADSCSMCGTSSCPGCLDCVYACAPHGCQTEDTVSCNMDRPDCGIGYLAVVKDGCWVCVSDTNCEEPERDHRCDDGTEPICDRMPPTCTEFEIMAYQESCYTCVNPATCKPWGEAGCAASSECRVTQFCSPCGTSSCPNCDDCLAACVYHNCPTQSEAMCDMIRPDCDPGEVSVVSSGCWECVDQSTCE